MLINALGMAATLPMRRGWRYLQISLGGLTTGTGHSISEIMYFAGSTPLIPTPLTGNSSPSPFVASASSTGFGQPYNCFDGSGTAGWGSADVSGDPNPWVRLDFGAGASIGVNGLSLTNATATSAFAVYGSQDATNWRQLFTASGFSWTAGETKTFSW
ncbi:discoidin domain-containing protein [Azospirillum sp. Sh1]|uniref:discoidin domain-containing protein n=1 Tax=Azospirillum sp. Sh1 TaxID=2607285 RepID=UPI0011EE12BB|nr:discoidin domain-containing protein [Azospirillum sp. Sh1]KAA0576667.1 discoidin domain-containing protein [Azospirillum sp. Sh1]